MTPGDAGGYLVAVVALTPTSAHAHGTIPRSHHSPAHLFSLPPTAMGSAYIFTLQPTFTQGLILGQASILFLLFLILKYLFFDTDPERPSRKASYPPKIEFDSSEDEATAPRIDFDQFEALKRKGDSESSEWLNVFLQQVRPRARSNLYPCK